LPGVGAVDSTAIKIEAPPLANAVRAEFAKNPALANIQIKQEENAIQLSGLVATAELKRQAEDIARRVPGVARVDARDLAVDLASAVTQALRANAETALLALTVEQSETGVRVRGVVDAARVPTIVRVAQAVPGVTLVDTSKLEIRKALNLERIRASALITAEVSDESRPIWGVLSSAAWTREGNRVLVASNLWWIKDYRSNPAPMTIYTVLSRLQWVAAEGGRAVTLLEREYDANIEGARGKFQYPVFAVSDALWSPGGDYLALNLLEGGNRCPYLFKPNGGELGKLPNCEADDLPRFWSENGEWLITWSEREARLYAYSLTSGNRVPFDTLGKLRVLDQRYHPWRVTDAPLCEGMDFWSCQ